MIQLLKICKKVRQQGHMLLPVLGSSEDSALALSSAVGSNKDHPFCSTACAAVCTVEITPELLASATTRCFKLLIREPPGVKPSILPICP